MHERSNAGSQERNNGTSDHHGGDAVWLVSSYLAHSRIRAFLQYRVIAFSALRSLLVLELEAGHELGQPLPRHAQLLRCPRALTTTARERRTDERTVESPSRRLQAE